MKVWLLLCIQYDYVSEGNNSCNFDKCIGLDNKVRRLRQYSYRALNGLMVCINHGNFVQP